MTTATITPLPRPTHRGTSNANQRGSSYARRRRAEWLVETYRANVDVDVWQSQLDPTQPPVITQVPLGEGVPACRCYRCGTLLTAIMLTVDRIIPGCKGGKYVRNNIRPACGRCNSETGGKLAGHGAKRSKR